MRILGYSTKYSGCGYHRVLLPLSKMEGVERTVVNNIEAVEPQPFDFLFFNRLNNYCDGNLDEARRKFGCKIIMDIDDYWQLPIDHLYHDHYKKIIGPLIEANIEQADQILVSTERLAEQVYHLNRNITVVPNALPFGTDQFTDEKETAEKVRIFWCGGSTHELDLEILRNPLRRLSTHRNEITMNLGGYFASHDDERKIWDSMVASFTGNMRLPFSIYPGVPPTQYMDLYRHADICLVPLRGTAWDGYKSNLKILEAAAKKIPVIVSAVPPYSDDSDAPVYWVKKQSDWYTHIKNLINDKEQREASGRELNEWARKKYDLGKINELRTATFRNARETQTDIRQLQTNG